jgi:O-antigen/teichoic acid export membrane protein
VTCALVYFVEGAVRVLIVWLTLGAGGSTRSIMCALAVSYVASGAVSIAFELRERRRTGGRTVGSAGPRGASLVRLFASMTVLGLLFFLDVPLVAFWFQADPAAQYAAAAVIARIALWLPTPFANTLFARTANEHDPRVQRRTLAVTVVIVLPAMVGLLVAATRHAETFVRVLLDLQKFPEAVRIFPSLMLAMSLLGLTWLLYQYLLAQGRFRVVFLLAAAVAAFVLLLRFRHANLLAVVENLAAVAAACCAALGIWSVAPRRDPHSHHENRSHPRAEPGGSMTPQVSKGGGGAGPPAMK